MSSPVPPLSGSRAQEQHQDPQESPEKSTHPSVSAASKISRPRPPDSKTAGGHPGRSEEDRQPFSGQLLEHFRATMREPAVPPTLRKRSVHMEPTVRDGSANASGRAWGARTRRINA